MEEQRPGLSGARSFEVTKGDVVHVPARVWHQLVLDEGQSMTYMLINVMEWPGT
jgi:mannose-6-phosphate isomerase-like protein (cupin superfamily)